MKKVALVYPGKNPSLAISEPLNIGYIASYLEKNDVKVKIIDQLAGQNVKKEIENYRPDLVGITGTTAVIPDAYDVADMCRKNGILTVIGGVHASSLPKEALQHADIVVIGEGEKAMLDIVNKKIKSGIVSPPYVKNIDEMPPPAWHLMQMEFYLRTKDRIPATHLFYVPPHTKVASLLSSRGCPYRCTFCHNSCRLSPIRYHSAERVIMEIKYLMENYGMEALFFFDDNLLVNKKRIMRICELMIENKFDLIWGCQGRVDNLDLEVMKKIKEAGCQQIGFGFESGSQKILDVLNKGTKVEQNMAAIRLCEKVGIIPWGTVMIGNPTETIDDIRATQQFIKESGIESIGVHITTPYPGTKLWEWCEERGLIPKNVDWSKFTTGELSVPATDSLTPAEIERLYYETVDLISKKSFTQMVTDLIKSPRVAASELARDPSKILKVIQKMKRGGPKSSN
jgi:radical SAM superfamily enzyme YgiQ (UPF0313 family)